MPRSPDGRRSWPESHRDCRELRVGQPHERAAVAADGVVHGDFATIVPVAADVEGASGSFPHPVVVGRDWEDGVLPLRRGVSALNSHRGLGLCAGPARPDKASASLMVENEPACGSWLVVRSEWLAGDAACRSRQERGRSCLSPATQPAPAASGANAHPLALPPTCAPYNQAQSDAPACPQCLRA